MKTFDYKKDDIIHSLIEVGLIKNDNIFVHSNLGFFGKLKNGYNKQDYYNTFKDAIFQVIGTKGTLVMPTFSYSFCNNEIFDKDKTSTICGIFSELLLSDNQSIRSDDPNFSIAGIGENAEYFTKDAPQHSFGKNSFWERFLQRNGKICNFNFDSGSTLIHYVEKLLNVPYRYDKAFIGKSIVNGIREVKTYYHFVYDKSKPNNGPNFIKLDEKAKKNGMVKISNLGKGQIVCINAREMVELIKKELDRNPTFLIQGNEIEL